MPIIEACDINFSYDNNVVLDHVSFSIEQGDYVGIVGPNGGGKTTLLKILSGLLEPLSGSISIHGLPVKTFRDMGKIGYVPQRVSQSTGNFPATVYELVESGIAGKKNIFGKITQNDRQNIDKALSVAGILELKNRLMSQLSGGQKQRAFVARALVSEPEILILDEPFVGIDAKTQKEFYQFLKMLNEEQNLTVIFVSHDVDIIAEEVKSILCLNKGILCLDSPAQLHEPNVLENLYGKHITHIHHHAH